MIPRVMNLMIRLTLAIWNTKLTTSCMMPTSITSEIEIGLHFGSPPFSDDSPANIEFCSENLTIRWWTTHLHWIWNLPHGFSLGKGMWYGLKIRLWLLLVCSRPSLSQSLLTTKGSHPRQAQLQQCISVAQSAGALYPSKKTIQDGGTYSWVIQSNLFGFFTSGSFDNFCWYFAMLVLFYGFWK